MQRPPPSLQARALVWLAQREQSRSELRRKLLRVLRLQRAAEGEAEAGHQPAMPANRRSGAAAPADPTEPAAPPDPIRQVENLLDALEQQGLLSEERFIASRVRVRASGQGTRRIEIELARHGLKLAAQPLQQLRDSELQRALLLWQRKFGAPADDAKGRARQMRFLAGRGFSGEVIRRVVAAAAGPQGGEPQAD